MKGQKIYDEYKYIDNLLVSAEEVILNSIIDDNNRLDTYTFISIYDSLVYEMEEKNEYSV